LHTSEGFASVAVSAHHFVNGIKQIGPYHTYFVNHKQIEASDNVDFIPVKMKPPVVVVRFGWMVSFGQSGGGRNLWPEIQLKE
jgi:hypothetical protein